MKKTKEFHNKVIETMNPDELQSLQGEKLRKQIQYVYEKSEFYQRKFKEGGLAPGDIQSVQDLKKIPFTTKDELRESQERDPPLGFHASVDMKKIIRIHSSSGTTGNPSFVGITRHDQQVWSQITGRSIYTWGIRPKDVIIHAIGLTLFVGGLPVKDAIEEIGATFVPIGTGASERVIFTTQLLGANVLHCTPSYAIYFSDYLRNNKDMDPRALGIRKIICGAEQGGGIPAIRKRIQEDYDCVVTEGMGNSDAAPIIFGECLEQAGMHFCGQEFILCEIIDPDTGNVLEMKEGLKGELVYTHLDRECCPLIRFRSRDHVEVWTDRCDCGRTSFRLRCLGRTNDMLTVLGVNVFPSAIRDLVGSLRPRTTGEIQVVLDKPGPAVSPPVGIEVEFTKGVSNLEELKQEIEALLNSRLSFRAAVNLVPEGSLPRYEMKAQLIKKLWETQ
jgi:phenylacetate-CoA ligase